MKGDLISEVQRTHNHARDPKGDDVTSRNEHFCRVVALQLLRMVRPSLRRKWPKLRGKPCVKDVLVLANMMPMAFRALYRIVHTSVFPTTVIAIKHRNAMAPPKLSADAPILQIFHPCQVRLRPARRMERDLTISDGLRRSLLELVDSNEPLLRKPWLQCRITAIAMHY